MFKDYYPPTRGGVEQHLHDIVHSLGGFEFEVLTGARSLRGAVHDDDGVLVMRTREYGRISTSPVTPRWAAVLRDTSADLVHFHMPNPLGELAFLAARPRTPMVATYHADIVGRRVLRPGFAPIQQHFLARARRIVVSSPAMLEAAALAAHRDRVVLIPFGADPDWSDRPAQADDIRAWYPGRLVLFLGRLVHYKGVDVLIEAMSGIDASLLVVGEGPERARLEALAQKVAEPGRVVFVGEIDDAERPAYYHAADLFVLPSVSRAEAFGIAALEALACGTPVVSTELGTGTSYVNVSGETGLVVPPRSPEALADAVKTLLGCDEHRRLMGEAARRRVRERFTREQMFDRLTELYESV